MEFFLPNGEKRVFPRTQLRLSCKLVIMTSQETLQGQCIDLSTTGAKVVLSRTIKLGTQVKLQLTEHLGMEPFQAFAEVTRVIPPRLSLDNSPLSTAGTPSSVKMTTYHEIGLKLTELIPASN